MNKFDTRPCHSLSHKQRYCVKKKKKNYNNYCLYGLIHTDHNISFRLNVILQQFDGTTGTQLAILM